MKPLNDVLCNKILLGNCIPHPHRPIIYFSGLRKWEMPSSWNESYMQKYVYIIHIRARVGAGAIRRPQ